MKNLYTILLALIMANPSNAYSWFSSLSDAKNKLTNAIINNPATAGLGVVMGIGLYGCKYYNDQKEILKSKVNNIVTEHNTLIDEMNPLIIQYHNIRAFHQKFLGGSKEVLLERLDERIVRLRQESDKVAGEHKSMLDVNKNLKQSLELKDEICKKITLAAGLGFVSLIAYNTWKNK
jgi:hypothetical protein